MQDRYAGAARRSGPMMAGGGIWSRVRVGSAALVLTVLVGLGHPGAIPSSYAQSSPIPFDLIGDQAVVSLAGELPAHDATVGRLAGSAGVSGGSASYEIPIAVPPGRRGMQPSISLNYSSRAGNGIAGMGWSLSGLSSLHRCPQTLEQDGQIRAVQLDANDRLCLDGQRLVATSGSYGASGTTYGTEMESFVRVTQLGGDLVSATSYFKVERKSGEIAWYGGASTSATAARVVPGGVSLPLTWMVAKVEDRIGNAMDYVYTNYGDGETLAKEIWYTGFAGVLGDRRVVFNYEDRPLGAGTNDRSSSYLAGGITRQTKRLQSVIAYAVGQAVRGVVLSYGSVSASTGRSLLQSVTDCAYDGASWVCKPPTTFEWQQGAPTHTLKMANLPSEVAGTVITAMMPAGDMDGDGATEVIVNYSTIVSLTPERTVRWSMPVPAQYAIYDTKQLADFNQDGRVDFVARDSATGTLVVRTWSGAPTETSFSAAFATTIDTGIAVGGLGNSIYGLEHIGDMDGDGRADLVVIKAGTGSTGSCARRIHIYRNQSNGASPPTFPEVATHCLAEPDTGNTLFEGETVQAVSDFDGDGLADILIESVIHYWSGGIEKGRRLDRVLFGAKSGSTYSLVNKSFSTLFQSGHARTSQEAETGLYALWADVNGDGLNDWLYARYDSGAGVPRWFLRYNRGGVLGQIYPLNTSVGLAGCGAAAGGDIRCVEVWRPWQAQHLSVQDYDGDGRSELMFPGAFAANVCVWKDIDYGACPGGDGTGPACSARWVCPEDPATAQPVVTTIARVASDLNGDGHVNDADWIGALAMAAHANGWPDLSSYKLSALRFAEAADGSPVLTVVPTPLISGTRNFGSDDLYGDGHTDSMTTTNVGFGMPEAYGILVQRGNGTPISETDSPRTLPGGLPIFTNKLLINENLGPAALKNQDGITPQTQDMLKMVTDGFGQQVVWNYSPLAGEAGRTAGMTPLYTVPMVASQRYIDERHIYFTSSMQVVDSMIQSDGIGGFRSWRYGYGEAMYNTQGRGFQGFRTIIEEDVLAGLRTTTTFHQKFPLTSQPERVVTNPISRAGEDGPIGKQLYTWRCDRSNRANAAACVPALGTPTRYFPFLDVKESWSYDATTAAAGGTPATLGYTQESAASSADCTTSLVLTSGYDAHGNLTSRTVFSTDMGSGTASGTRARLELQCVSESNTYAVDTANWWLDKLTAKTATTSVSWDASQHPLPSGTANPLRAVSSSYVWNADRTLSTETVQAGIANQQRVTAYTYPSTNNHGLPTGVAVSADGDANGTRSTGTSYTADGYFPLAVVNALGHSATTTVRARDGQPDSVTDANGLRTLIEYDAFGFATRKKFRGATDAVYLAPDQQMSVIRCLPSNCWRPVEQYQVTTVQDGSPTRIERNDALGRTSVVAEKMLDGDWSHVVSEYSAKGQLVWRTEPLISYQPDWVWTTYFYDDILGRMTKKIVPKQGEDGRGDMVTTYSYSGRTTHIQVQGSNDAPGVLGLSLSRTTDSLGRYVETRDALNGRTRFWYEANGNVAAIEDANGVVTKASYNSIGQRTGVNDPNQGAWSFVYNALGEVTGQTDARSIATQLTYDKLGRPKTRTATVDATGDNVADSVVDTWSYDPVNAKGAPEVAQRTINGVLERSSTQAYDALARPVQSSFAQAAAAGTQAYLQRTKYDSYYGRPVGQEFPNGEAVQVLYSIYGHGIAEKEPVSGVEYRRTNAQNARGQVTQETFGNGVTLTPTYQLQTGQLTGLTYSNSGGMLRQLGYGYDVFGNLKRQSLNNDASREDYSYDELHRLVQSLRSGAASGTVNYGFDAVGNLTTKSDFSANTGNAYSYTGGSCGGGANAVKSIALAAGGTRTYCYDANGNLTGDNAGLSLKYDHQNLPIVAQRGALRDDFRYGPDGMRTRSWGSDGSRVYLPGYEHRTDTGETKVYIGDYAVISRTGATRKVEYLLKDRLGSVDAVADSSGAVTETRGYDAFGKPRSGTWNDLSPAKIASTAVTPKGFTQHEHLNQLELIHMNGRMYDYNVGRFMGVDPFIQFPLNSQSLNPYSYILNNPLSGTDPTGYTSCNANGDAVDCANAAGPGGEAKVYKQDAGSRIKTTVGSVKNNGDGSATFTNNAGDSKTIGGGNGGNQLQGVIGSRLQAAVQAAGLGAQSSAPNVSTYGNGGNSFTTWDGKTATVDVRDYNETKRTIKVVDDPTDAQKSAAIRWAQILDGAHKLIGSNGDQNDKDGAKDITYFVEATRGVADRGSIAQALQNRDDKTGEFTAKYMQLMREPVSVKYQNGAELMFSALHEFGHFYATKENWSQIVADHKSGKPMKEWSSELSASVRAFAIMKGSYSVADLKTIQDAGYGRDHIREARREAGIE